MKKTLIGLVAGLVLAGAGVALASIPDAGGVIHGCYKTGPGPASGQLRVIDTGAGQVCASNETTLTWNQTGPQGSTGATGASGADGATGPQGPEGAPGTPSVLLRFSGVVTAPVDPTRAVVTTEVLGTYTQEADELDRLTGRVDLVSGFCTRGSVAVGNTEGGFFPPGSAVIGDTTVLFSPYEFLPEPGSNTARTVTVTLGDCPQGAQVEVFVTIERLQ